MTQGRRGSDLSSRRAPRIVDRRRHARLGTVLAIAVFSSACARPVGSDSAFAPGPDRAAGLASSSSAPRPDVQTLTPSPDVDPGPPAYTIGVAPRPGAVTYYTIENEVRDSGGILGISYATTVRDKRSIIQRVLRSTGPNPAAPGQGGLANVSWECDRYEVREESSAMNKKKEAAFDSLRDSYPPEGLRELGKIPGSRVTFAIDPRTGKASRIRIRPAKVDGPPGRKKLSAAARKCSLTHKTLKKQLFDLGAFYLPKTPKRVGQQWTLTHRELHPTFGMIVTDLTCTLRSVREVDGRKIADIDLSGKVRLDAKPTATSQPAAAGSARRPRRKNKRPDFEMTRAICTGSVAFDLTRGELAEMTLRRELDCVAKIERGASDTPMMSAEARTGMSRVLRVKANLTPPPKPVIVGGPRPPAAAPKKVTGTRRPPAGRPRATTRPWRSRRASVRRTTTQPAHLRPGAPARPRRQGRTTQPTDLSGRSVPRKPAAGAGRAARKAPVKPKPATTQPKSRS